MVLDSSLIFYEHLISVQSKTIKTMGLLRNLQNTLRRQALITIYKAFLRLHLNYGDILDGQSYNASFMKILHQKLEKIQFNACIACIERENISRIRLKVDSGLGNYVSFLKFGKINHRIIPQRRSS